ncbi:hypothetical protein [Fischerella sp. PCC 9605]|uniref:hypothetical protein n=1 Tax=Fischerella sp. PCC 9605 TaxID=1173024 RepID=UPI00047C9096|nr:hypothetical protein [Fischerella sp. PCC 9605]
MLKPAQIVKNPSVERLLKLWAQRYKMDLSSLSLFEEPSVNSFSAAASPAGRALTTTKLKLNSLNINTQMAWILTKSLYNYIPNVLDFSEARRITEITLIVYCQILNIYQQQLLSTDSLTVERLQAAGYDEGNLFSVWGIPPIEELAYTLEPTLIAFQGEHTACQDWRAIGFMTTQLKFTNKLILKLLAPVEKILLCPYFKFIEEQVAIPWQRICAASVKQELDSPTLILVEQMLLASEGISKTVYSQLVEHFPNYHSRSGNLTHPDVAHSSIRDLNMFQAYLYLCILEQSLVPIEQELLPLCKIVLEKVEVKWEILEKWMQLLIDEIIRRVKPEQNAILLPYIQGMQQAFFQ